MSNETNETPKKSANIPVPPQEKPGAVSTGLVPAAETFHWDPTGKKPNLTASDRRSGVLVSAECLSCSPSRVMTALRTPTSRISPMSAVTGNVRARTFQIRP